jgi:hypothetical protein
LELRGVVMWKLVSILYVWLGAAFFTGFVVIAAKE